MIHTAGWLFFRSHMAQTFVGTSGQGGSNIR